MLVILGGKNPCVVELASNTAEALAADDAPTITFPFTVALANVPTLVKPELTTFEASVVPVNVPAAATVEDAAEVQVLPSEVNTLPLAPGATVCRALAPFPNKTLLVTRVELPVPPLITVNIPVTPVVNGSPVKLVATPEEGVPVSYTHLTLPTKRIV